MLYNNWSYQLFDEFYPRYKLSYGEITWFTSEVMKIKWGEVVHEIPLKALYDSADENPSQKILKWVYSNMPMLKEELAQSIVSKDFVTEAFSAHCKRGGSFYRENISDPYICSQYGNVDGIKELLQVELEGSILRIESTDRNIPVSAFLSHKDLVNTYIGKYFYDYGKIDLMFDATRSQPRRIIVGHENSIRRFADDTADFRRVPLLDWFNKLPKGKKNNE